MGTNLLRRIRRAQKEARSGKDHRRMTDHPPTTHRALREVYHALLLEVAKAMGLPRNPFTLGLVRLMFGRSALQFTKLTAELDRRIRQGGIMEGARWLLGRFTAGFEASGAKRIPRHGPLLVVSNHPASYDGLVISAFISRRDFKIIVGDIPFFRHLPHVSRHLIFSPDPENVFGRMQTVRLAIRHLQSGGSLLIFPRGTIEPDPAFMPQGDAEYSQWSRSLEIFLKNAPRTQVLTAAVSGVISQKIYLHPFIRLRRERRDRQRLAFIYQMALQALSGRELFGLRPRVTFGELLVGGKITLAQIESAARRTLAEHVSFQGT
jgi:1-acyl-sn-glycerol-3-phosphate acyltransferase